MNNILLIRNLFVASFLGFSANVFSQTEGYYDSAVGKKGADLKSEISRIISNAKTISYDGLWSLYRTSDVTSTGKVWDMYSGTSTYTFGSNQCGSYQGEGDCYNREHSVPQSWFNSSSPMKSDAWHVVPTDGYVNNRRSNFPFGEVKDATYTSENNFSKLGPSKTPGYSGTVFEPNDEYKGDFARMYFYMATRYENNVGNWGNGVFSSSYPHLSEWTLAMFLRWHEQDPVSQKEKDRNNAIYSSTQHNRNPYIDYPELVDLIFGDQRTTPFDPDHQITDPDDDFKALDASSVSANGFIANWTQKNEADDYYLHVYQKQTTSDSDEVVELWSCNFADGIPEDWTPSTSGTYQEVDGLRLGTGSNDGSITSPTINTEQEIKLTIKACRYKTDAAKLMVYIDNQLLKTYDLSKSDLDEELVITSHSSNSKIKFLANKSKRVILQSVTCETNSQEIIQSVEGYPLHTGNNLSYEVKSLLPETDYYYTVTPYKGNNSYTESNEVKVTTSVYSSLCKEPEEDQIITFYANGYITVLNAAPGSKIMVYNTNGALVMNKTVRNEEESLIMPEGGIYILKVLTESKCYNRKITAY